MGGKVKMQSVFSGHTKNMFLFVLFILFVFILIFVILDVKKPSHFPPGPTWWPLIGSLLSVHHLRRRLGYLYLACRSLAERYGPIVGLRLGRNLVIVVSEAEAIHEMLSREEFSGRPNGFFFRMRTFGRNLGLIFSDGPLSQKQRRFTLHQLKQLGLGRREMEMNISDEVQSFVDGLKQKCQQPVEVHSLFDVSVINVLWMMVAGKRFQSDDHRLRELLDIIHEQFRASDISGGLLNQLPFLRHILPGWSGYRQHVNTLRRMYGFLEATVAEHRRALNISSPPCDLIEAFLQQAATAVDGANGDEHSEQQLLSTCMDLFMAGSETTTNTLEFIVLYLVRYPEVQQRMQKELDSLLGRDRMATLRDRPQLPYTTAVLNEVQRCAHVVPLVLGHRCTRSTTLFGYHVPRDTVLLADLHALHTDPAAWPEPLEFRPERFLQLDGKQLDMHFAPFGNGRRRCLGESLAKSNMFLVITALFHTFSVSAPPGCELPKLEACDGFTLSPKPYRIIFTLRS